MSVTKPVVVQANASINASTDTLARNSDIGKANSQPLATAAAAIISSPALKPITKSSRRSIYRTFATTTILIAAASHNSNLTTTVTKITATTMTMITAMITHTAQEETIAAAWMSNGKCYAH